MTYMFTASNGVKVTLYPGAGAQVILEDGRPQPVSSAALSALREAIRADEDAKLGRWRDATYPNSVVYPRFDDASIVTVLDEEHGLTLDVSRGARDPWGDDVRAWKIRAWLAADAYFAAHSAELPKPWHDAKVGDVWALTERRGINPFVRTDEGWEMVGPDRYFIEGDFITGGEKIWPRP